MTRPTTAYKVLTGPQMADLEAGSFAGAPIDIQDGYIHLSTAAQLTETVDKHFADEPDLWVAAVDLDALGDVIKWEVSRGGAEFPHLYAALTLDTVVAYSPLERSEDGSVALPVTG
ncbi:DUF952 domain-containing protein [Sphingomonas sp.]|jgi:uncharacterized protein (DUF952 family)|uniref:DUF952 domain-containing protein n=1 Tax=Sphingomonas sp. TaxID=28214 RepID=UPI0017EC05E3|nr:DUF952 domain-containing protein [Sphingomonas sp.]MBA4761166.1 DUF952 domain-containing protein [Sphingomonas sp.]